MTNLSEFCIDSWDVPHTFDLHPFYAAAWSSFGPQIRCLSLGGNLQGFRVLITSNPSFTNVQELVLEFTNNLFRVDDAADTRTLTDLVTPFVNNLAPQLRLLKLWSWASIDLSSFFENLHPFPRLQSFSIRTAFNKSFRSNPSALSTVIRDVASTLRSLEIRLNPTGSAIDPTPEQLLSEWLSETMNSIPLFKNLHTLQLYPTPSALGLEALLTAIRASSETMRTLVVRDRYLRHDEINLIVVALGGEPGLTSLRLNIWKLTAALMDLLAASLPNLEELSLYVGDSAVSEPTSTMVSTLLVSPSHQVDSQE